MTSPTHAPVLLLLSAPSGAGKTTVCANLLAATPDLARAITCTTRAPRPGERAGVDYHFLTAGDFEQRVRAGEFLEHAQVYDNRYGTLKAEVLDRLRTGHDVLLNIDVQGAENVRAAARTEPEVGRALVTVFLAPPSLPELERRLVGRGQDAPETIERRLAAARRELAEAPKFDYFIRSGTMAEDLHRVQAIHQAEKLRTQRVPLPAP